MKELPLQHKMTAKFWRRQDFNAHKLITEDQVKCVLRHMFLNAEYHFFLLHKEKTSLPTPIQNALDNNMLYFGDVEGGYWEHPTTGVITKFSDPISGPMFFSAQMFLTEYAKRQMTFDENMEFQENQPVKMAELFTVAPEFFGISANFSKISKYILQRFNHKKRSPQQCNLAPKGWSCSREAGHEGPCAAWPATLWLKIKWTFILCSLSPWKEPK